MKLLERLRARRLRRQCEKEGHDLEQILMPARSGWHYVERCGRCGLEKAVPISRNRRRRMLREGDVRYKERRRRRRHAFKGIFTTRQAIELEERLDSVIRAGLRRAAERSTRGDR